MIFRLLWAALFLLAPCLQAESLYDVVQRANRKTNAKMIRNATANLNAARPLTPQSGNGDEERYADKRGSYGKGLKQLDTGLVDPVAFKSMVYATQTGLPADFNKIIMALDPRERGLHSPQAGISYNLWGVDNSTFSVPPAPTLVSAQRAGEVVELYWERLAADVFFQEYGSTGITLDAIDNLNTLSDFRAPKIDGEVTPQTLFRSSVPGALVGPYVSQFLMRDIIYCDTPIVQRYRVPLAFDEATNFNEFMTQVEGDNQYLFIQEGHNPTTAIQFDPVFRYIRNARDLGNFVHKDPPQMPYTYALLILITMAANDPASVLQLNNSLVYDQGNPYLTNPTQEQFAEFFKPQICTMINLAGEMALRAAWYQKWFVQRILRPEEYGFLLHQQVKAVDPINYGLNSEIANNTAMLNAIFAHNAAINNPLPGTYLLPQAFPEGAPMHPAYPAGHATCAGACVTILKAWFNEDYVMCQPNPENPAQTLAFQANVSDDGITRATTNDVLTIGGELNKLAANVAMGRNMAGVHYRCDMDESLMLGEKIAIAILEDWAYTNNINFAGFSLTKFDGTKITVGGNKRIPLL